MRLFHSLLWAYVHSDSLVGLTYLQAHEERPATTPLVATASVAGLRASKRRRARAHLAGQTINSFSHAGTGAEEGPAEL